MRASFLYCTFISLSLLQRKVILKFLGNLFSCVLPCWRRINNCQSCHNFQIESFRRQTCPLARVEVGASELICGYERGRGRGEIDDGVECKEASSCRSVDSMSGGERGSLCQDHLYRSTSYVALESQNMIQSRFLTNIVVNTH